MKKRIFSVMTSLILVVSMLAVVPCITVSAGNGLYWPVPGHTSLSQGHHSGYCIDINDGSIAGATVIAAKGGTVYKKYTCTSQHSGSKHTCDGFGTGLIIKGDDGRYYGYAHMQGGSIPSDVYVGAYVSAGQKIGQVGKTGNATGNHLHFYCGNSAWKGDVWISTNASDYIGGGPTRNVTWNELWDSERGETATTFIGGAYISNGEITDWGFRYNVTGSSEYHYIERPSQSWDNSTKYFRFVKWTDRVLKKGTDYQVYAYIDLEGVRYWSNCFNFTTLLTCANLGDNFSALILNNHCWKPILQEDNGNVALGTESKNNYDRTLWHFVRNSNGSYTISSYYGGVLDVNNAADADGTNVQVWSNNGGTAQQWYIIEDNGAYLLRAACTSRVLDVNGMATADGTNVQTWSSNGTEAQRFAIYKMNSERDKLNYSIESSKTSVSKNETVDITVGGQIGYVYNYKFHVLMPNGEEQVINNKSLRNYSLNCTQVGKYVVWAEIKNPLYTECGSATNKAVTINVTCTHKYTTTVVAPTATAQGYTLHKCSICGNSYKDNYTEKLALDNVTGFKATATTASSVSFTWNKVSNASGYIVYREVDGKWKGVGTPTSNKFTDTPLSSNKEYKYAIRAYKKLEDGSKKYSASMVQLTAHTCLINCSNFKSTSETKAISFTWNAVKDVTGYIMYKKIDGVWTGIGTPRTTSFTDTEGLYSGCTYQYAIRAYKKLADGTKIYSESLKTLETSTRPVTTTFTLTAGTKKVDISWVKTAGATSYKVYYKTASSGDWIELATVDKNTFSYTKSGLTSGKTYWFTVKAVRTVNGRTYNGNFAKKSVTVK